MIKFSLLIITLQIVGTAKRETVPDVPMFAANPAKRPRRETLADTLAAVGHNIVNALLNPESSQEPPATVEKVLKRFYTESENLTITNIELEISANKLFLILL